jgi:hypothetical protein
MNTKWECFCDECYFHLWRVRRKNERGFDEGFHVHNKNEAESLMAFLNGQDMALDIANRSADDQMFQKREALKGIELMRQNAEHWKQEAERWRDASAIRAKIAEMRGQMNGTYGAGRGWEAALDEMEEFLKR